MTAKAAAGGKTLKTFSGERRLHLSEVLPLLVADGLIAEDQVEDLERLRSSTQGASGSQTHPLVWLADGSDCR